MFGIMFIIIGILLSGAMFFIGTFCHTQKYNRTILVKPAYKPEDWFVPVGFTFLSTNSSHFLASFEYLISSFDVGLMLSTLFIC